MMADIQRAKLSPANTSKIEVLGANSDTPVNVVLGANTLTYNNTAYVAGQTYNDAVSARTYLTTNDPLNWTIVDGGEE